MMRPARLSLAHAHVPSRSRSLSLDGTGKKARIFGTGRVSVPGSGTGCRRSIVDATPYGRGILVSRV